MYVKLTHKIQNCQVSDASPVRAPWASALDCLAVGASHGPGLAGLPAPFPARPQHQAP